MTDKFHAKAQSSLRKYSLFADFAPLREPILIPKIRNQKFFYSARKIYFFSYLVRVIYESLST